MSGYSGWMTNAPGQKETLLKKIVTLKNKALQWKPTWINFNETLKSEKATINQPPYIYIYHAD